MNPLGCFDRISGMPSCFTAWRLFALQEQRGVQKDQNPSAMRDWEVIADNLSKAGWSWGTPVSITSDPPWGLDSGVAAAKDLVQRICKLRQIV